MKKLALDSRGIAHFAAPFLVVLVVAVGGTYMLVSSHADTPTPKKAKSVIKITSRKFTTSSFKLTGRLQTSKGTTISQSKCSGEVDISVIKSTGTEIADEPSYAHWQNDACVFTVDDPGFSPGSYKVTVVYKGNSHYKAAGKRFSAGVKKPKVDNTVTSGGDSLGGGDYGQTVVAPPQ